VSGNEIALSKLGNPIGWGMRDYLEFKRFWQAVVLLLAFLLPGLQAFAGGFQQALPGYKFSFPKDHATHNNFKTEWWYYSGHLAAEDGRRFGYELTFFRRALDDDDTSIKLDSNNIYVAHFAISDLNGKRFSYREKIDPSGARGSGAKSDTYKVWNGDWSVELVGNQHHLNAKYLAYTLDLLLTPLKEPVIHGADGVSRKASCAGCASHYYSLSRMKAEGTLTIGTQTVPVVGLSWMDHEFGTKMLGERIVGWDWYAVQLDEGTELMLYVLRNLDGTIDSNSAGTFVGKKGSTRFFTAKDFSVKKLGDWKSPASGVTYPSGWQITIPIAQVELTLRPALLDQELITNLDTYWEGASTVEGKFGQATVKGEAFVELAGYQDPVDL
jgi:predicted secreted hydrolase